MKHVKEKFNFIRLWIILGILFGVLVISYAGAAYYFSYHFGFNTSIDNIDCSFKTVEEVEASIAQRVDEYEMSIVGREGLSKRIKAPEVGLAYVPDGQIRTVMEEQHPLLWIARLFTDIGETTTHASVRLSEQKFETTIKKLDLFNERFMRPPVDAYSQFQESQYVIVPEDAGSTLDEARTKKVINENLRVLASTLDLDETGCYVAPKIFANNPDLIEEVRIYNIYAPFSITYTFGDKTELLDASIALEWIERDGSESGTLNEDALIAWVRDFGARHDTVGSKRSFTTAQGEEASVEGGNYGWEVNEEAEIEAIRAALENHTGETREPYYVQTAADYAEPGKPDWGTTYIELDLTGQHMYYFVDGAIEFEADVVTGSPWGSRATPTGVYRILEKLSPTVLKGDIQADGRREYETKVSYWMRITWIGHGFHDATWQPAFGGNRYTFAGSHGCINMSYSDAQELYELIEVGLPVISHS
jgi:hypothetical protein